MSALELARKAYAAVRARRNGCPAASPHAGTGGEKSERSDRSPPPTRADERTPAGHGYVAICGPDGLNVAAAAAEESAVIGLDLETTGLDPRAGRARLLSLDCETIADGGRFTYLIDCFAADPRLLFDALAGRPVIAHNAAFDLGFLGALGFTPGPVRDTMLLSQLLHGTRRPKGFHTLAAVSERELGRPLDKAAQKGDWTGPLTAAQLAYAAADAAVLAPLCDSLAAKVKAAGLERVAEIESRALPAVAWMSRAGVAFDRNAWDALAEEAKQRADALALRLDDEAPARPGRLIRQGAWNWSSPEQVKGAFAAAGVALDRTDDDALAAVDHPLARLLRDYRSAAKLASTYGPGWYAGALRYGRIYAGWRQIGADSGRMACAGPNLQNLPRDARYRRCFVAQAGRVLVKADYSQIELRIAATLTGDKAMLDAYARGEDLHTATARLLLGVEAPTKAQRQLAKAVNFGLLYGMGVNGFRAYARSNYGVALTEAQARDYRAAFFRAYPGLARWHDQVRRRRDRESRTLAGRRRLFDDRTPDTQRLNTPVQGTGADGLKLALALLWERRDECHGAFPVLAVHDEIVIEAGADRAEAAAAWLRRAMNDGMAPLIAPVPVEVETKAGRTWEGE